MKPGRELDALVAEKVMGGDYRPKECPACGYDGLYPAVPRFSTDIAAAWLVVEKMRANGFRLDLSESEERGLWDVYFEDRAARAGAAMEATAPHAICLAALKAVGA